MKNKQQDIILIESILKDDHDAQKMFYNKYRTILNDYIKSKYPNNFDLEDDVSEILIKIFTNLYKFDQEKATVKTWVFTIAKNYMIDKSRSNNILTGTITLDGISDTISLENFNEVSSSDQTLFNPDEGCWHYTSGGGTNEFENCDAINFVSNQLSTCDFTFLNMKYGEGYNYNEIGVEFNVSSNTVSNRVNYIKGKLKCSLIEEMEE